MATKTKTKPAGVATFTRVGKHPFTGPFAAVLDHYAGLEPDGAFELWNTVGGEIEAKCVLVRSSPINRFALMVKVGANWHKLMDVSPEDPAIAQLMADGVLETHGPSPMELATRDAKEEAKRYRVECEEDLKEQRATYNEVLRRKAQEYRQGKPGSWRDAQIEAKAEAKQRVKEATS